MERRYLDMGGWFGIGAPAVPSPPHESRYSLANGSTNVYAGFGHRRRRVWRLSGTTWTQIGGDALSSSWAVRYLWTVVA